MEKETKQLQPVTPRCFPQKKDHLWSIRIGWISFGFQSFCLKISLKFTSYDKNYGDISNRPCFPAPPAKWKLSISQCRRLFTTLHPTFPHPRLCWEQGRVEFLSWILCQSAAETSTHSPWNQVWVALGFAHEVLPTLDFWGHGAVWAVSAAPRMGWGGLSAPRPHTPMKTKRFWPRNTQCLMFPARHSPYTICSVSVALCWD